MIAEVSSCMSLDEHGFLPPEIEQYREKIRLKNQHFFNLAENLNSYGQQIKYQLKIQNRDGQQIFAVCLLIKLLNDIQAAMILLERGLVPQ